jgi:hypothetical protein
MCACELGGFEVFWDEIDKLMYPALRIRVAMAFFPDLVSEALKDEMAQQGTTREDLKVLLRRLEALLPTNEVTPSRFSWECTTGAMASGRTSENRRAPEYQVRRLFSVECDFGIYGAHRRRSRRSDRTLPKSFAKFRTSGERVVVDGNCRRLAR